MLCTARCPSRPTPTPANVYGRARHTRPRAADGPLSLMIFVDPSVTIIINAIARIAICLRLRCTTFIDHTPIDAGELSNG